MDIAKKYPYSLVQVRSGVGEEQTVINVGVIIYEEDKKTIHQAYYHPDRDLVHKYLYDIDSYYSFFKECQKNKKVGLLPMELHITEPKTFNFIDAFGEERTYKNADELAYYIISTLVHPKELRTMFCTREKQFVLEKSAKNIEYIKEKNCCLKFEICDEDCSPNPTKTEIVIETSVKILIVITIIGFLAVLIHMRFEPGPFSDLIHLNSCD